tara:strand:+ start:605 stop:1099 length:495 start_codon:yes stop_codon:yes gene_type:complete
MISILNKKFFFNREIILIKHFKGAPGLRFFGIGPNLLPCRGLYQLKVLLDKNTSWAINRTIKDLKHCLANSDVVVSLWSNNKILGFGRALSDGTYRSVLWDIVIDHNYQGKGYGKLIVNSLLESKSIKHSEKVYLMTSNQIDFYGQIGFQEVLSQNLLIKKYSN